jgi:GT2 family glycosyltransferase
MTRSTIVVVTWRGKGHVGACLDALAAQTRPHRLLVVDNASDDGTAEVLATHPSAPPVLRLPANAGYAGALAAVPVETEFTAWLNDDAAPAPDWLERLEDALDQDRSAAAAGSRMVGLDGSVLSLGVGLTPDGHGVDLVTGDVPVFGFCGGAVLLRTSVLRDVGGVPGRFFCYYEDTDTAWRLRLAGHTIVSVPTAEVTHRHGASSRPGSRQFHLWNERNRLDMLIRCAPAGVAAREVARFVAITVALPVRRVVGLVRRVAGRVRPGMPSMRPEGLAELHGVRLEAARPEAARPEAVGLEVAGLEAAQQGTGTVGATRWKARTVDNSTSPEQANVDNPRLERRIRQWAPVAWKRGPEASRMTSKGSAARSEEPTGAAGHLPAEPAEIRKTTETETTKTAVTGTDTDTQTPWNFRVGLRLQVLVEVTVALPVTLRERRTISRVVNVPRLTVWRWARSVNSIG